MTGTLWHYSCSHRAKEIIQDGFVRPAAAMSPTVAALGEVGMFAWFTDLEIPNAPALGLDGRLITRCDRTEFRFRVTDSADVVPWVAVRRQHAWLASELERHDRALPMHWYVATVPVPVEHAPR